MHRKQRPKQIFRSGMQCPMKRAAQREAVAANEQQKLAVIALENQAEGEAEIHVEEAKAAE